MGGRGSWFGGRSTVGHRRGHPAVLLVGFHQGFEGGLGLFTVESFLGLARFPTYTTLQGRKRDGETVNTTADCNQRGSLASASNQH